MADQHQYPRGTQGNTTRNQRTQPNRHSLPILSREHGLGSPTSPSQDVNKSPLHMNGNHESAYQQNVMASSRNGPNQSVRESRISSSKSEVIEIEQQDEFIFVEPRQPGPTELQRALNANQITMITIGTTFGTGFLVASGKALYQGGPLGVLIAYLVVGFISYTVLSSICEMATYMPHRKGFVGFASRYLHPAIGFALGWTYVCKFLFVPAAHINIAAMISKYFKSYTKSTVNGTETVEIITWSANGWRGIYLLVVVSANFLNVRRFGQLEFYLSTAKILVLIALIVFGTGVDAGGTRLRPDARETIKPYFGYWQEPHGPMGHMTFVGGDTSTNNFLGLWACTVRVWFSYMGTEQLGFVVGEARNPRISVPKAVKRTYRFIIILYVLGIYIVGLICPSDHDAFRSTGDNAYKLSLQGHVSPFRIAFNEVGAKGLVPAINAAIIIFALSGAISNLYTASRVLHGLALDKQAPSQLALVVYKGVPVLAILLGGSVCAFSFLGNDERKSNEIFDHFVDFTTTAGAISWICILLSHIRFRRAIKKQSYPPSVLRFYRSPVYPYGTWFALVSTIIFTIFKGVESVKFRQVSGFFAAYILVFAFALMAGGWWYWKKDRFLRSKDLDLVVEQQEI